MKLLKNYKKVRTAEKKLFKEVRIEAREKALLKVFLIFLPFYLICLNLFVFVSLFYPLIIAVNLIILLTLYFYQYFYYLALKIKNQIIPLTKTVIYGVVLTIIIWVIAYFVGGLL